MGETLADPVEGIGYGRCKAKILRRSDGSLWIKSFAHGGSMYALKFDATDEFDAVEIAPDKAERTGVSRSDFYAYMPMHNYIYRAVTRHMAGKQRECAPRACAAC